MAPCGPECSRIGPIIPAGGLAQQPEGGARPPPGQMPGGGRLIRPVRYFPAAGAVASLGRCSLRPGRP